MLPPLPVGDDSDKFVVGTDSRPSTWRSVEVVDFAAKEEDDIKVEQDPLCGLCSVDFSEADPVAAVAIDANHVYIGADRNFDGIPDALQDPVELSTSLRTELIAAHASGNHLRAELSAVLQREAAAVHELNNARDMEIARLACQEELRNDLRQAQSSRVACQEELSDELRQSLEHGRLTQEYAEQLQSMVALRDCELAEARSAAPDPDSREWQNLRVALHECRAELADEKERVERSRTELEVSGRESSQRHDTIRTLSTQVADLESMLRERPPSLSRGRVPTFGSELDAASSANVTALQTELSRSLQENVALESSVQNLAHEAREALELERELHEAFFEQSARLRFVEGSSAREKEMERERHRSVLERHEIYSAEEASSVRRLRSEMESSEQTITALTELVRSLPGEQRAQNLQLELNTQLLRAERLQDDMRMQAAHGPAQRQRGADEEFKAHVREVQQIADAFRWELSCVQEVGAEASARRDSETIIARRLQSELASRTLECHDLTRLVQTATTNLRSEMDIRDREVALLKSEMMQSHYRNSSPVRSRSSSLPRPGHITLAGVRPSAPPSQRSTIPRAASSRNASLGVSPQICSAMQPMVSFATTVATPQHCSTIQPVAGLSVTTKSPDDSVVKTQVVDTCRTPPLTPTVLRLKAREETSADEVSIAAARNGVLKPMVVATDNAFTPPVMSSFEGPFVRLAPSIETSVDDMATTVMFGDSSMGATVLLDGASTPPLASAHLRLKSRAEASNDDLAAATLNCDSTARPSAMVESASASSFTPQFVRLKSQEEARMTPIQVETRTVPVRAETRTASPIRTAQIQVETRTMPIPMETRTPVQQASHSMPPQQSARAFPWQAESVETVHERLRQRVLGVGKAGT
jgi:hypothetical protein